MKIVEDKIKQILIEFPEIPLKNLLALTRELNYYTVKNIYYKHKKNTRENHD
jgi:hypothetical protein